MDMGAIKEVIDAAVDASGLSAREASVRAGSPYLIRDIRRGHVPSVDRLNRLCRVLGLELTVAPRTTAKTGVQTAELQLPAASDRQLADLLAAIEECWETLGTAYAREVWRGHLQRQFPELAASKPCES